MSLQAIEVLQRIRIRVLSPEWCRVFWRVTDVNGVDRACLHTMVADEVQFANRGANVPSPSPLDGEVFHSLWDSLPPECSSLTAFNDASSKDDVVVLVDKAIERIFWSSLLRFLTLEE